MGQKEPPSSQQRSAASLLMIGRDREGHWVVKDPRGLCGGLFVSRAVALKFALFENGNRPQAIVMVPDVIELNMSRKAQRAAAHAEQRRAA